MVPQNNVQCFSDQAVEMNSFLPDIPGEANRISTHIRNVILKWLR